MINAYADPSFKKYTKKRHSPTEEATHIGYGSRVLCVAGSGGGKTNCFYNFLRLSPNTFCHVVIVNKGVDEPIYDCLKDRLGEENISFYTLDNLPRFDVLAKKLRESDKDEVLICFDDLSADLRKNGHPLVEQYFSIGRKMGFTSWFLSQTYVSCPIFIRHNCTHLMLGKLASDQDMRRVLSQYTLGVTPHQMEAMYREATRQKLSFLYVHIEGTDMSKKFSKNFNDFFPIEGEDGN